MPPAIVAQRTANALITDVEAQLSPFIPGHAETEARLRRFKAAHRGLWVGGKATLTSECLSFRPNSVNRRMHTGALDVEIPVADIVSIRVLPALVSSVIAIGGLRCDLKVRCFRAEEFARQVSQLTGVGLTRAEGGRFKMRLSGD